MRLRTAIKIQRLIQRDGGRYLRWKPETLRRSRLICTRKFWDRRFPTPRFGFTTTFPDEPPLTYERMLVAFRKTEAEMAKIKPVDPFFDWPPYRDMVIEEVDAMSQATISRMGHVLFMHPDAAAELRRQCPEPELSKLLASPFKC